MVVNACTFDDDDDNAINKAARMNRTDDDERNNMIGWDVMGFLILGYEVILFTM